MKNILFGFLTFMLVCPSAFAGCYTIDQYRAEQAIRLHSSLMVVGLYCKNTLRQDSYATYQNFTRRNQNVIQKQENILIAYFRQNKQSAPDKRLHTMRTDMANKISLQAGQSPQRFCNNWRGLYERSKTMIPRDFQRWIEQTPLSQPSSQPLCAAARRK